MIVFEKDIWLKPVGKICKEGSHLNNSYVRLWTMRLFLVVFAGSLICALQEVSDQLSILGKKETDRK